MNVTQTLEQEEIERLGKTIPAFAPGDTVIVKTRVPLVSTDGDLSMEIGAASFFLTSKCFTVYGSFLASDPAASLVNLEACTLIE